MVRHDNQNMEYDDLFHILTFHYVFQCDKMIIHIITPGRNEHKSLISNDILGNMFINKKRSQYDVMTGLLL